jgi:O-acetyl-ADP-ribose deacetylase (regulator of RNase III)
MIVYLDTDLFKSPAQTLVNPVNTVGVMGKGLAGDFRLYYPEMFKEYQKLCEDGEFGIGQLWLYKTTHKWILNFPTKNHWKEPSKEEYIEKGLTKFVANYIDLKITTIAFPMVGCGNGELDWEKQVKPLVEKYLGNIPVICLFHLIKQDSITPEHKDKENTKKWLRGEPASLGFVEVWDDILTVSNERKTVYDMRSNRYFHIELDKEKVGLRIFDGNVLTYIHRDDFLDLWQRIRSCGYLTSSDLPPPFQDVASVIVDILSCLEYVKPARVSYRNITENGLQLVNPLKEQKDLFSYNVSPTP